MTRNVLRLIRKNVEFGDGIQPATTAVRIMKNLRLIGKYRTRSKKLLG